MQLGGLHHVTAVTGNASRNVAFYTQILGLRLIKKTVNQDDVSAYHLFYGDEIGHPGTEVTFFDWPMAGPARPGVGTISAIALGVTGPGALVWWAQRFDDFKIAHDGITERGSGGPAVLAFRDPEGQRLELVDDRGTLAPDPWPGSPVPPEMAIHGLYAVTFTVRRLEPTARVLTQILGFRQAGNYPSSQDSVRQVEIFEAGPGGPGAQVHLDVNPALSYGRVGIGGVHHVAFRTPNDAEQQQWRDRIAATTLDVTEIIDRYYFHSIYFREPGGVLLEIATDGPGFTTDEDPAKLGERLSLPPFLEPYRKEIEPNLEPITPVDPRSL